MIRRVVVWNLERLFDPSGTALSRSVGALADWTPTVYRTKVKRVAAVLEQMCPTDPPALLLLSEVENSRVTADLLRSAGWTGLTEVTVPNEQIDGHDVTTVYDPTVFEQLSAQSYNVHNRFSTRDLLVAELRHRTTGETVTVINAHWPSRTVDGSEPLRLGLADFSSRILEQTLKFAKHEMVDSRGFPRVPARDELTERWNRRVIVAGDFNDDPFDASVRHLGNSTPSLERATRTPRFPVHQGRSGVASYLRLRPRLFNPTWSLINPRQDGPIGTYRHDGEWHWLDQLLVSPGMLVDRGPRLVDGTLKVHAPLPMVGRGTRVVLAGRGGVPRGFTATGGVSDHHPFTFDVDV